MVLFHEGSSLSSPSDSLYLVRWPKGTKISDFIFSAYRKIKSEIFPKISDFIFSTYKKIKSEILPKISDFIFL